MRIRRGEIWWADLGEPRGSEPGYLRPVFVLQDDAYNRSSLATVIVLSLTSEARYGALPGNVGLSPKESGLDRHSVVNATQVAAIDKAWLAERVGRVTSPVMRRIEAGVRLVLGFDPP